MLPLKTLRSIPAAAFLLFIGIASLNAQTYRFSNFGPESRIPDPYIYTISQDNNGFLWIGTGMGIVKFDGFDFYPVSYPDSAENRIASVLFRDQNGRIWVGCKDGKIFWSDGGDLVELEDMNVTGISDIFEDNTGNIWIIPQDRKIFVINSSKPQEITSYGVPASLSMKSGCITTSGKLLLGTPFNLLYCSLANDSVTIDKTIRGIEYTGVQKIIKLKGEEVYLVGTDGSGVFRLVMDGDRPVLARYNSKELEDLTLHSLFEDSDKNIWMVHSSGVIELGSEGNGEKPELISYNTSSGLPGNDARAIYQDNEGNIWMGFYGEGLSMLSSNAFTFYSISDDPEINNIIYIAEKNNKYLLGTAKGIYYYDITSGKKEQFTDLTKQSGAGDISCYYSDDRGIWFGTRGNGLYLRGNDGITRTFLRSGNSGEDYIRNINSDGKNLWLSTLSGVLVVDESSRKVIRRLTTVPPPDQTSDRLPHNSINMTYIRRDGSVLPATETDRLYSINRGGGVTIGNSLMIGQTKNKILSYSESTDGKLFVATYGNGVFYYSGDTVASLTVANGLFSNYCYSIFATSDSKVWIGHERGFSRYDINTGAIKAFSTEFAKNGDCNPGAIIEDRNGKIVIGTTEGLIIYDKTKERQSGFVPVNNITGVTIDNIPQPIKKVYNLPYGNYTIRISYVGIRLSDPGKIYYSTRLEKLNEKWSELKQARSVEYNLSDGKYRFNLFSYDEEGVSQDDPLWFDIIIMKPVWRRWWFILIFILVVASTVTLIIREREKAQRKLNEYLEKELAERTRLVMKQKDEIELQNIEITDSINYAKRIQSSILPEVNKLKETFRDAFIVFHPRDIVSGDFYWFDRINDEKFIIVCADSTGHGVPGAFMSMIGSTLLQDIILRKNITRPSEVLSMLDTQIFSTLNQNVDVGISNDGMDMVVCEINSKTRHVRFASAMRPVIIVMGGESYYIKGNRCSVGGESVVEKYFDDQEYYLGEGDTIYLFSDGLPDQFGGSDGKKMKIARLKRLIEELNSLPMDEQQERVTKFFLNWKGDYEQVDDVLMMGIRL
jgi:ligand-binding sensor domain-containing protein/serine phosphatase RsbU (regulator of sigma subunit)